MHPTLSYPAVRPASPWPWLMLIARPVLFLTFQALFALGHYLAGSTTAWEAGAAWWPWSVTLSNLVCLVVLIQLYRAEGQRFWDVFRVERRHLGGDLLLLVGALLISGPLAYFPNVLLAGWLFDSPETVLALFVRPLPLWAAWASLGLFPVTQGLVELATYMIYARPRIEARGLPPAQAVLLAGAFLSFQHVAAPLLLDGRFFLWRLLMYLPFAVWVALLMRWRPRLLPYMAGVHVLMNMSFATMFLAVAY